MSFLTADTIHQLLVEHGQFEWHDDQQVNLRIYEHEKLGLFYSLPLKGENHINQMKLKETLHEHNLVDENEFDELIYYIQQKNK